MNDDNTPHNTPLDDTSAATHFSWQIPDNYQPKHDYYADLVVSYSAMTDIVNPQSLQCDYADIRVLDAHLLKQSLRLHELADQMLHNVHYADGDIISKRLEEALRVQHAFRENYSTANRIMTHRYIATAKPL